MTSTYSTCCTKMYVRKSTKKRPSKTEQNTNGDCTCVCVCVCNKKGKPASQPASMAASERAGRSLSVSTHV